MRNLRSQYPPSVQEPERCPICEDERQYIGWGGQKWITMEEFRDGRRNVIREAEPGLTGIGTEPKFAIGQRALLVRANGGNVLWDCVSLLDDETVDAVRALGGISVIAISHPHYYSSMVEWSRSFDAPIYLHADDREWVMRPDPAISYWEGEVRDLGDGISLVRCGGHFAGGTVMHWPDGADGRGALLTGDIINVVQDRRYVSFMYSYPNQIPLPVETIRRIADAVEMYEYDRIHGAWWDLAVWSDAKNAVARSAARYIAAIEGDLLRNVPRPGAVRRAQPKSVSDGESSRP